MKKIIALCAFAGFAVTAGAQGIQFESGDWKAVTEKAKKEKKLIYVDIYTTWCGPCKVMAAQIFPDARAGKKYNDQFINFKIDAEKGEGVALAHKYKVDGYPTNLYINPETEEVVYRVMGATDVDNFLERADVAALEHKDPMKWPDYESKFAAGSRDKAFLVAYLSKAERLSKPNDKALSSYVEQYAGTKPTDSTLKFLVQHTTTLDNKAVELLYKNRTRVDKLRTDIPDYFDVWVGRLPYGTLEKAIAENDEHLLTVIEDGYKKYEIKSRMPAEIYYYKKEFYNKTGNEIKAREVSKAEADYLSLLPVAQYEAMDKEALKNIRSSIIYQLKGMNVPESKFESSIEATLNKNPDQRRSATMVAANTLNETAWKVFESKRTDKEAIAQATKWSARSLEMAKGSASWPLFADTHASLLFAGGEKTKAIALEEEAIKKAEETGMEGAASLKETLEKMKADKL
jgi:thiol-disulfide isomerase/thioredoxin